MVSVKRIVYGPPPQVSIRFTPPLRAVGETRVVFINADPGQDRQGDGPELALKSKSGSCEGIGQGTATAFWDFFSAGSNFAKYFLASCDPVLNAATIAVANTKCALQASYAAYSMGTVGRLEEVPCSGSRSTKRTPRLTCSPRLANPADRSRRTPLLGCADLHARAKGSAGRLADGQS